MPPTYLDSDGYVGLTGSIYNESSEIRFDEFRVFSLYPPQSGSDVMEYLAAISNMDTNERMEIDDSFPGISFGPDWDAPGVDGTWSVSGGTAVGYKNVMAALIKCSTNAAGVIVKATVNYDQPVGIFARGNDALSKCYALVIDSGNVYLTKKDTTWSTLMQMPWTPPLVGGPGPIQAVDILLHCSGPYITGFVNGSLFVYAYDADYASGYCGMVAIGTVGSPSYVFEFQIDGFHSGIDVVTVKPKDTAATIMSQITNMYDSGAFFSDNDGKLRWGKFSGDTADLDVRGVTIAMSADRQLDRLLSYIRAVGANAYGEVKDRDWGRALAGYEYDAIEDKTIRTRHDCNRLAEEVLAASQKIGSSTLSIIGHPGLEIGDAIDVAEEPGDAPETRRVWAYSEVLGSVYEMNMTDLRDQTEETL